MVSRTHVGADEAREKSWRWPIDQQDAQYDAYAEILTDGY